MNGFAAKTDVSPEKTRVEIERVLRRYKADSFTSGWHENRAHIMFRAHDRLIRFEVSLPDRTDPRFVRDGHGAIRSHARREAEYDQAVRSVWRRLLLCIKAKLESVESGIETFEEAFLAHVVLPGGETAGDWLRPQIEAAYTTGSPPPMLALPAPRDGG